MAADDKTKKGKPKEARAESAVEADVRAVSAEEVRVDADEKLSYKEYAAKFTKPIVTIQRIIDRKGLPLPKKRDQYPNMEIRQVVKWGEMPKEDPPKPDRVAATIRSEIMHVPPAKKPPPPGIGSIEPPGG